MIKLADSRISIHALRGEGDEFGRPVSSRKFISIHALRGEGDKIKHGEWTKDDSFQSTPSVGRATMFTGHL